MLIVDVVAGVTACVITYYVALPDSARNEAPELAPRTAGRADQVDAHDPHEGRRRGSVSTPLERSAPVAPRAVPDEANDGGLRIEDRRSMMTLRNEVIRELAEDVHRRGENVMRCLDGVHLAGAEKIRFAVDVVSTPLAATTGQWRFVEIADGEPLPASFASCAARALGGGQHVVPPEGFRFPQYAGDLLILYTIPAPASE